MTKKRFLLALALMLTAVGGAWAQGNTTPVNWNAATQSGTLTTPAGNVTLTVDYYGQYTLDSVPTAEGWQVLVNGTARTVTPYTEGNTALGHVDNINETDSVELIPPAELRGTIKAVRLTESVAAPASITINDDGVYDVQPGETWQHFIQRQNGWDYDCFTMSCDSYGVDKLMGGEHYDLHISHDGGATWTNNIFTNPSSPVDCTKQYKWVWLNDGAGDGGGDGGLDL